MNKIDRAMTQKEQAVKEKAKYNWEIFKKRQKMISLLKTTKQGGLLKKMKQLTKKTNKKFGFLSKL